MIEPSASPGAAPNVSARAFPSMNTRSRCLLLRCLLLVLPFALFAAPDVVLENTRFRYVISGDARNLAFVDRATGVDHLRTNEPTVCASVRRGGTVFPATSARRAGDRLALKFGGSGIGAELDVESRPTHLVMRLASIDGTVDSITFLNVPLDLAAKLSEDFGACALSLNLHTRVDALPALHRELKASCETRFGLLGGKAAIVAAPMARMLPALQETLLSSGELPNCKVAGPWAQGIPFNHGSYLFNYGSLVETNVQEWIAATRRVGFTQIDNHGGPDFFRFGDLELDRKKWPDGWDSYGRVVSRLHDAGIGSILHTYAFFIDKHSKYVAPVPDARLDAFRTFTLAGDLAPDATEIAVNEPTKGLSTVTGFFEHNSVVLHVGDELVTFGGFANEPPWRFTGVKRAALGTKAAPHARGSRARQLKESFGLFVPDPESTLFAEIAANHADVVNRCGFDGIYLDALDGASILRGEDASWYWADKFVVEIQKRLKRPVGMEMSAMWHHCWQYRTRWQAWDFPRRGQKRFVDLHAAAINDGLMLPLHLGWWGFTAYDPPQVEPSYPDVIEHVGARLVGWDAGISLAAGMDPKSLDATPLFARAAETLRICGELRRTNTFDAATKERLRDPNLEFALSTNASGRIGFRTLRTHARTIAMDEPWSREWTVTNAFAAQPARFRVEALMSAARDATNALRLADLASEPAATWTRTTALGVSFAANGPSEATMHRIVITNAGGVTRTAAVAKLDKRFPRPLDVHGPQALSVEVDGDGSGAVLAIRLESPKPLAYGAIADHYVPLDFTGRRRFTLVESESSRWSDYHWNDGKSAPAAYRALIHFNAIESIGIWVQNLPRGRETRVGIGAITALPLRAVHLENPRVDANGVTLEFPIDLTPGSWIEANGPGDCVAYGPKGERLGSVKPIGSWPTLAEGTNAFRFECAGEADGPPRARVTVFALGDEP